jgi:hypothetical protein
VAGLAQTALSVHILAFDSTNVLSSCQKVCRRHGITHTTIQIERTGTNDPENCASINSRCDTSYVGRARGRGGGAFHVARARGTRLREKGMRAADTAAG